MYFRVLTPLTDSITWLWLLFLARSSALCYRLLSVSGLGISIWILLVRVSMDNSNYNVVLLAVSIQGESQMDLQLNTA